MGMSMLCCIEASQGVVVGCKAAIVGVCHFEVLN